MDFGWEEEKCRGGGISQKSAPLGCLELAGGYSGYVFDNFGVLKVVVWYKMC